MLREWWFLTPIYCCCGYDCEHAATMQGLAQGVGRRFGIGETFARSTLSADEWRYMWWPWFTDHN